MSTFCNYWNKVSLVKSKIKKSKKIDSIGLGLASPEEIRRWGERRLPNGTLIGKVDKDHTVDYESLKPIEGGLFCERIFGPVEDFYCSCERKGEKNEKFCPNCEVEFTKSRVRRIRMGYIPLAVPVVHVWYLRGRPSYIANLVGKSRNSIDRLAYGETLSESFIGYSSLESIYKKEENFFPVYDAKDIITSNQDTNSSAYPYLEGYAQKKLLQNDASFSNSISVIPPQDFTIQKKLSSRLITSNAGFNDYVIPLLTPSLLRIPRRGKYTKQRRACCTNPLPLRGIRGKVTADVARIIPKSNIISFLSQKSFSKKKRYLSYVYPSDPQFRYLALGIQSNASDSVGIKAGTQSKPIDSVEVTIAQQTPWGRSGLLHKSYKQRSVSSYKSNTLSCYFTPKGVSTACQRVSYATISKKSHNICNLSKNNYAITPANARVIPFLFTPSGELSKQKRPPVCAKERRTCCTNPSAITNLRFVQHALRGIRGKVIAEGSAVEGKQLLSFGHKQKYLKCHTLPLFSTFVYKEWSHRFSFLDYFIWSARNNDLILPFYAYQNSRSERRLANICESIRKNSINLIKNKFSLRFSNKNNCTPYPDRACAAEGYTKQRRVCCTNPLPLRGIRGKVIADSSWTSAALEGYANFLGPLVLQKQKVTEFTPPRCASTTRFLQLRNKQGVLRFIKVNKDIGFLPHTKPNFSDIRFAKDVKASYFIRGLTLAGELIAGGITQEKDKNFLAKRIEHNLPHTPIGHLQLRGTQSKISTRPLRFNKKLTAFGSAKDLQYSSRAPFFQNLVQNKGFANNFVNKKTSDFSAITNYYKWQRSSGTPTLSSLRTYGSSYKSLTLRSLNPSSYYFTPNGVSTASPSLLCIRAKQRRACCTNRRFVTAEYEVSLATCKILTNLRFVSSAICTDSTLTCQAKKEYNSKSKALLSSLPRWDFSKMSELKISLRPRGAQIARINSGYSKKFSFIYSKSKCGPLRINNNKITSSFISCYKSLICTASPLGKRNPVRGYKFFIGVRNNELRSNCVGAKQEVSMLANTFTQRVNNDKLRKNSEGIVSVPSKNCVGAGVKVSYAFSTMQEDTESTPLNKMDTQQFPRLTELLNFTGGAALRNLLSRFDLIVLSRFLRHELKNLELKVNSLLALKMLTYSQGLLLGKLAKRRSKQIRRLKLLELFQSQKSNPEWMILSVIPVLPPDLRPILRVNDDFVVASDLNRLYQTVLRRNNTIHERLDDPLPCPESGLFRQRSLQKAVDGLLENGKGGGTPLCASKRRPLVSLSHVLKGKKGLFRQHLLGKRVDYSGRSVIVVGPRLQLHECGLPKEMAIELFQPFLLHRLKVKGLATSNTTARRMIQQGNPVIWHLLKQLVYEHPVLLNRAPTLHRLGIQAFQPRLVSGRAILLHPLVCNGFNADFDGDQMAVHVPLSFQARAEAWKIMWSKNNFLSPATGQPILVPSQDMVLGCYYLSVSIPRILNANVSVVSHDKAMTNSSGAQLLQIKEPTHTPNGVSYSMPLGKDLTSTNRGADAYPSGTCQATLSKVQNKASAVTNQRFVQHTKGLASLHDALLTPLGGKSTSTNKEIPSPMGKLRYLFPNKFPVKQLQIFDLYSSPRFALSKPGTSTISQSLHSKAFLNENKGQYFCNLQDSLLAYFQGRLQTHTPFWVRIDHKFASYANVDQLRMPLRKERNKSCKINSCYSRKNDLTLRNTRSNCVNEVLTPYPDRACCTNRRFVIAEGYTKQRKVIKVDDLITSNNRLCDAGNAANLLGKGLPFLKAYKGYRTLLPKVRELFAVSGKMENSAALQIKEPTHTPNGVSYSMPLGKETEQANPKRITSNHNVQYALRPNIDTLKYLKLTFLQPLYGSSREMCKTLFQNKSTNYSDAPLIRVEANETLESPLELRLSVDANLANILTMFQNHYNYNATWVKQCKEESIKYMRTTAGRVVINDAVFKDF